MRFLVTLLLCSCGLGRGERSSPLDAVVLSQHTTRLYSQALERRKGALASSANDTRVTSLDASLFGEDCWFFFMCMGESDKGKAAEWKKGTCAKEAFKLTSADQLKQYMRDCFVYDYDRHKARKGKPTPDDLLWKTNEMFKSSAGEYMSGYCKDGANFLVSKLKQWGFKSNKVKVTFTETKGMTETKEIHWAAAYEEKKPASDKMVVLDVSFGDGTNGGLFQHLQTFKNPQETMVSKVDDNFQPARLTDYQTRAEKLLNAATGSTWEVTAELIQ